MDDSQNGQRDHVLRRPLETVIAKTLEEGSTPEEITEQILLSLSALGVIQYAEKGSLKLLTPAGRVLVALMERPNLTMRELSMYLGVTEAGVMKQVVALVKSNVIARTKVKGRNEYRLNLKTALQHPDIARFYTAIQTAVSNQPKTGD